MIGHDVMVGAASLIINGSGIFADMLTSTVLNGLLTRSALTVRECSYSVQGACTKVSVRHGICIPVRQLSDTKYLMLQCP